MIKELSPGDRPFNDVKVDLVIKTWSSLMFLPEMKANVYW